MVPSVIVAAATVMLAAQRSGDSTLSPSAVTAKALHVSQKNATWTATEYEQFKNLTVPQFRAMFSMFAGGAVGGFTADSIEDLPQSVDWSTDRAFKVVSVVDPAGQGYCANCWAWSSSGALESRIAISTEHDVEALSVQQVTSCAGKQCKADFNGCGGGTLDMAWKYMSENGVTLATNYPWSDYLFNASDPNDPSYHCNDSKMDAAPRSQIIGHGTGNGTKALMQALQSGPVAVQMAVGDLTQAPPVLMTYKSGIFDPGYAECTTTIAHGMLLVGYGVGSVGPEQGVNYWKLKNSFGSAWGEAGYIRIKRADDDDTHCGPTPPDPDGCTDDPDKGKTLWFCGMCGLLTNFGYPIVG